MLVSALVSGGALLGAGALVGALVGGGVGVGAVWGWSAVPKVTLPL